MSNYKQIIREELGVNQDVKTLAEFIFKNVKDYGGMYTFYPQDLPSTKQIKIDKLIIQMRTKTNRDSAGLLNLSKSKITENGLIIYLEFFGELSLSTVYHELTHALQLAKVSPQKMAKDLNPTRKVKVATSFINPPTEEEKEVIEYFTHFIYQAQEHEISARVTETYQTLKEKLEDSDFKSYKKGGHTEISNLIFNVTLRKTYGWRVAEIMEDYNIFSEFKKLNEEDVILFFSHVKYADKYIKGHYDSWPRFKEMFLGMLRMRLLNTKWIHVNMLSEDEVINLMSHYNKVINNSGRKLKRKLVKLYGHFA